MKVSGAFRVIVETVLFYALLVALILAVSPIMASMGLGRVVSFIVVVLMAIPACLLLWSVPWVQKRRMRARVRRLVTENPEMALSELVERVQNHRLRLSGTAGIEELARALAQEGRSNETLRLCLSAHAREVSPLAVQFEPRFLDETDSAFVEIQQATSADDKPGDGSGDRSTNSQDGTLLLKRMWRNVNLKSGKLTLIVVFIFFARSVIAAIIQGAINFYLILWTVILFGKLLAPATGGFLEEKWFVVPRGVVLRLSADSDGMKHYFFDRLKSQLAVYQLTAYKWKIIVADADRRFSTGATRKEVNFLLRAWLSSTEPLPKEQLTSLT